MVSDLRVYLERPVPVFVMDVIAGIAGNVRKYGENERAYGEWKRLSRRFGVDDDVITKVRDIHLLRYYSGADDGMGVLAKLAGADAGSMGVSWFHLIKGNYEFSFIRRGSQFCFDVFADWNDAVKRRRVARFGCIDNITLEDALVILYNITLSW